jgi:hypothetical protein
VQVRKYVTQPIKGHTHHYSLALGAFGAELLELVLVDVTEQLLVKVPAEPAQDDAWIDRPRTHIRS